MTVLFTAYSAAFVLGAAHAVEVDHVVAMNAFIGRQPRVLSALGYGIRWGFGHAITVLLVGGLLAWSGVAPPASWEGCAELLVGSALIALGLWTAGIAPRVRLPRPEAPIGQLRLHPRNASTLMGAVHGLAGSAAIVTLVPVSLISDRIFAVGYLVMFGVGTVLAMAVYSVIAAVAVSKAGPRLAPARIVAKATGVASVMVGAWWIAGAAATLAG